MPMPNCPRCDRELTPCCRVRNLSYFVCTQCMHVETVEETNDTAASRLREARERAMAAGFLKPPWHS